MKLEKEQKSAFFPLEAAQTNIWYSSEQGMKSAWQKKKKMVIYKKEKS